MEVNNRTPEALAHSPREELRRMLAEELNKDAVQIDDAFVRLLLAELKCRGMDPKYIDDDAVEAACETFRQSTVPMQKPRRCWYQSWMLKVASVVLVLGILFFALPAAAEAKNVPEVLTWWSDSLFQFFRPGSKPNVEEYVYQTDHPGLQEIHDAVTEAGITVPIVPSKLSDKFKLAEHHIFQLEENTTIYACLTSDHNEILFTAITHNQQSMLQHEKRSKVYLFGISQVSIIMRLPTITPGL